MALIQMSQALNLDAGSRAQWSNVVANLSPLPIVPASSIPSLNALGAPYNNPGVNVLRATSSGGAFYPNPAVTLYQDHAIRSNVGQGPMTAIYPGWNIGLESPSYSLLAASNTVWLTGDWYDYNADNFSYPSAACIGFDPNQILTNLDTFLSLYSYNNFMIDAGGGGTEQYSTVPGTLAAMFVQSYQTNMHIFPDWPTNQSAAFGNLNACGGFLVSSAITLGKPNYIQIQSTEGQMLKLVNPWSNSTVQCVSSINGTTNLSGAILDYQTQVGEVLTLTTTNAALSAPTSATVFTNGNSLVLNWNPVSGAAGYNVKRSTSPNGPFTDLASVTSATSYTDASVGYSTTYYYEITALEPGYESTNSIVLTATSGAKPPILNNSFELQNIGEGNYLLGDPTDWSSLLLSGTADAVISPGPSGTSEPWPTIPVPGLDGTNFCQIYASAAGGGGLVYQDTGIKYQAGISYILTAAFGLQNSQTFTPGSSFGFYNSSLTPVAWTTINTNSLTKGAFVGNAVNYTATGNEGGNGDIVIGFNMPAAASAQSYFDFDDVFLSVTNTTPPVITSEPVSQTVALGTNATFSVGATGTGLNYQWYFDTNTAILRATNATLPLTNVQSHGTYDVVVSNTAGSLTSSIVGLTVAPGPLTLLDAQFGNNAIQTGAAVLGSAGDLWNSVTGSTANLFNAAGTSLSGAALTLSCQGTFSDTNGSAMDVATTPLMEEYAYGYTAPANVRVSLTGLSTYEGDTFTLIVYGAGDGSGQGATLNLTGATGGNATNTLTTTATSRQISLGNGIAYQTFTGTLTNGTLGITASIPSGGTFAIVNGLQLQLVPQTLFITTQPVSESTNAGNSVFFNVDATGTAPSYQWYFDTNTPISGGTNATLSLTNVRTSGTYDVTVSNAYGSLTSSIAKLTVLPNAPSTMTATPGVNEVTLTYGAVANAKFYVIYRSKVSGGSYTKIATTTATKYTDHNVIAGTTYFYVVIVCDGVNLSAYSQQVSGKPNR